MTIERLTQLLSRYPSDAIVKVYNVEVDSLLPVTDVVYGSGIVELITDSSDLDEALE